MKKRWIICVMGIFLAFAAVPSAAAAAENGIVPEEMQDAGQIQKDIVTEEVTAQAVQENSGSLDTSEPAAGKEDSAAAGDSGIPDLGEPDSGSVPDGDDNPEPAHKSEFVQTDAGTVYYDEEGQIVTGKRKIGGQTYYFNSDGIMQTGWCKDGKVTCYCDRNGYMMTGIQKIDGYTYYFAPDSGAMCTGFRKTGGKIYYHDKNGRMVTGKRKIDGYQYLFKSDGSAYTGWRTGGKKKYYYDSKGCMAVGSKKVGKHRYYFKKNGSMHKNGFYTSGKKKYYSDKKGYLALGSKKIGNYWYYFDKKSGVMQKGLVKRGKYTYYYDSRGHRIKGAKKIKGKWYYFEKNGKRTTSAIRIRAIKILDKTGWNLRSAFNYSASMHYRWAPVNASLGTEWFADYGFKNGCGNCYVMAGTFCYLAKMLGYKAYQVSGYVPSLSGGVTPHSWVEVVMDSSTYVFDPDLTEETGQNGYMIWYGKPGAWPYSNYRRMK